EVLDQGEGARPHRAECHQPRAATQRRARGELRPEGEQTGTAGHPAEEEVDRDRLSPRRRLDDGASVVGVELARTLDLDVLDDRTLARAVAHPDLGETVTPTAAAAAAPARAGRRRLGVAVAAAHRRRRRSGTAAAATIPAAAMPTFA